MLELMISYKSSVLILMGYSKLLIKLEMAPLSIDDSEDNTDDISALSGFSILNSAGFRLPSLQSS